MYNGIQAVATEKVERDSYADFLKYLLISLVVLGHFVNMYQYQCGLGGLYTWIYTFHMPLFVFISGHFSRHISSYRQKNIDTLLWPFVVFQFLNIIYAAIIPIEPLKNNFFYPYHQNWYLISLFWWRSFIPYHKFFKKGIVSVFAFLISLTVGFYPEWSGFLGLYKSVYYLPFFVLGVYCEDLTAFLSKLIRYKFLLIGFFVLSILILFSLSFDANILNKMNYAFKPEFGYNGEWHNMMLRLMAIMISIIMCASILLVTKLFYNKFIYNKMQITGGGVQCSHFLGMNLL